MPKTGDTRRHCEVELTVFRNPPPYISFFWGCGRLLQLYLAVPSCVICFWHSVIHTSYFIFILVYTWSAVFGVRQGNVMNFWKPELSVQEFTGREGCLDCQAVFKFIHDGACTHNCLPSSWVYTHRHCTFALSLRVDMKYRIFGSLSSQSRRYSPSLEERVVWSVRLFLSLFMMVHVPTTVCPSAGYICSQSRLLGEGKARPHE